MIEPTINMLNSKVRLTDDRVGTLCMSGHISRPNFYVDTWSTETGAKEIPMCPQTVRIARVLGDEAYAIQKQLMTERYWAHKESSQSKAEVTK